MTYLHTQRVVSQLLLMCVSCTAQVLMPGQQKDTNGHNETTNDRTGLTGAVLDEDLVQTKVVVCQGDKLYISCPNIYHKIQILVAFYGREDVHTCRHPEYPSDKICAEQNTTVLNIVKDLCQGESRCEVTATNDFLAQFQSVICPNVFKYLYVIFRCVPKGTLRDVPEVPLPKYEPGPSSSSTLTPIHCCRVGTQSMEERIISTEQSNPSSAGTAGVIGGTTIGGVAGGVIGGTTIGGVAGGVIGGTIVATASNTSHVTEIIQGRSGIEVNRVNYQHKIPKVNTTQEKISELELRSRLQAQARRFGMANLISLDRSQLGNAIAKPNKRGSILKPTKYKKKRHGQKQLALIHSRHRRRFQIETTRKSIQTNTSSLAKKMELMAKLTRFEHKKNRPQPLTLNQSKQGESARLGGNKRNKQLKKKNSIYNKRTLETKSTWKGRSKSWL